MTKESLYNRIRGCYFLYIFFMCVIILDRWISSNALLTIPIILGIASLIILIQYWYLDKLIKLTK